MADAFILTLDSSEPDQTVLDALESAGLTVDREYGVLKIDVAGRQRVARVFGSEVQLVRAQQSVPFTYYPDLTMFRAPGEE